MHFVRTQWLSLLAILFSIGSLGSTIVLANSPISTVDAIKVLCEQGETGAVGETGSQGEPGLCGPQGEQGECGPQGEQGIQGEPGSPGEQGIQGETGPCGPQGVEGPTGPQGPRGEIGPQGPQGPQGEIGASGPMGLTGPQGATGDQGPRGESGAPGATGPQGPVGPAAVEVSYSLVGGTTGSGAVQPAFSSDPLFYGSSIRNGDLVFLAIQVDFDNITSFGTGQYFVSLPYPSKYDATIREGHLHRDSNGRNYPIVGHLAEGSSIMTLWFTAGTGQDEEFDRNSPYTLTTSDDFHIAGTYIAEPR